MKMLSAILMFILSMSTFASSETKTFYYDGSEDSVQMNLRAEKTHTEYRYEQRRTICYRQEVHYQRICQHTPQGHICQTIPHYRTISFPCIQTVRVAYEVKDYDVEASVNLSVSNSTQLPANETLKVTLNGDMLYLSAVGSKNFFILQKKAHVRSSMNGSVKMMDGDYSVDLVEAMPVVKALELTNISLSNNILNFTMGPVAVRDLIGFKLNVSKAPIFGSDTVVFDRELTSSEIQLNAQGESSTADVNIQNLGVQLTSGRYSITAKAFFKYEGSLLNSSDFEKTESSRTLIYKIR